jgi:fumarylpyruvate hydrolase
MSGDLFPASVPVRIPVRHSAQTFPVHRVYCIGRNYHEHAREMGVQVEQDVPVFFMKPADALCRQEAVPYPTATDDLHHEVELVLALGSGGAQLDEATAENCIIGYALGIDLTRRDLQAKAKKNGTPWDSAKGFDHSAPISELLLKSEVGRLHSAGISLHVNGALRQSDDLSNMARSPAQVVAALSQFWTLAAGDVVFTGTPAGVGPLHRGDRVEARLGTLLQLGVRIV